jgi:hypothetical protein
MDESAAAASGADRAVRLAELMRDVLVGLARPELEFALAQWPAAPPRRIESAALPVLRWLPELARTAPAFSLTLVAALAGDAFALAWRQSYQVPQVTENFLENYGWSELAGPRGPLPTGAFACGFLLLGPRTHYPSHHHEAYELYLPLAGESSWQKGDRSWQTQRPGTMIIHSSDEPHAMQTRDSPLLALYFWRSDDLLQSARLDRSE